MTQSFLFYQLFESTSSTYTYLLADPLSKEGLIIDPVLETVERDYKLVQELGIRLLYTLETHVHADHITGSGLLASKTGATIAMHKDSGAAFGIGLEDGQVLRFGNYELKVIATPGHTNSCLCYLVENTVFTGDTLLIRGNGRTDFQQGSAKTLYESIQQKLYSLPDDTLVFPAHDYNGMSHSTIGLEKTYNRRITASTSEQEFVQTMAKLQLPLPKKIDVAVPANLHCGLIAL